MAGLLSDLDAYVRSEIAKPFAWGATDCAMTTCGWIERVTGVHPLERYGRAHANEGQARAWLGERGGLGAAMSKVMRASGFRRTDAPAPGDVGLVGHTGQLCAAILTQRGWFSRSETGLICVPSGAFLRAWRIA